VVAGRDGSLAHALPDGRVAVLFDYIDGRAPARAELTPPLLTAIGHALSALHAVPPAPTLPHAAVGGCASFSALSTLLQALDARGDDEDRAMAALLREVRPPHPDAPTAVLTRHAYTQSLARLPDPRDRSCGRQALLHTDVFPDNVLVGADGRLLAVIDFEELCVGPRLLDVAFTLAGCCYALDGGRATLRAPLARALLQGYDAGPAGPLLPAERLALGAYLELAAVILVYWRYRHFNVRMGAAASAHDRRRYCELLPLLTAIVADEGVAPTTGHLQLLRLHPPAPEPEPQPAPPLTHPATRIVDVAWSAPV
jgi:Ser/Thr protein kinase RdoA (MazF antagonist)